MLFERVNFIKSVCCKMTKDEFIAKHIGSVWQDRDEEVRKKMLSDAYDVMMAE